MEGLAKVGVAAVIGIAAVVGLWLTKDAKCLLAMLLIPAAFEYWPKAK